jgi:hypothetical protein
MQLTPIRLTVILAETSLAPVEGTIL